MFKEFYDKIRHFLSSCAASWSKFYIILRYIIAHSYRAKKKPVYTGHFRLKVFMFIFFSIASVDRKQIFSKPVLH